MPSGEPDLPGTSQHAAIRAYEEKFNLTPPPGARQQLEAEITDLDRWQAVLDYWEAGCWRPESIPKMLDRYRETEPTNNAGGNVDGKHWESASARHARERLESAILLGRPGQR